MTAAEPLYIFVFFFGEPDRGGTALYFSVFNLSFAASNGLAFILRMSTSV